jgi:hypothetical protein
VAGAVARFQEVEARPRTMPINMKMLMAVTIGASIGVLIALVVMQIRRNQSYAEGHSEAYNALTSILRTAAEAHNCWYSPNLGVTHTLNSEEGYSERENDLSSIDNRGAGHCWIRNYDGDSSLVCRNRQDELDGYCST